MKTWSSHTSEETQVEKEVLLLKVWDLFKMLFLSIATIFKCTETHQELYEKLPMFPLPRIRTPTSIFCSTSPIALSLLLLKYLKACPISCHLSPSYSSEHLFKKKKNRRFYIHNFIFVPNHINRDSLEPVLPRSCPKFKSIVFKLCEWKRGLRGRE